MKIVVRTETVYGSELPESLEYLYEKYDVFGWRIRLDDDFVRAVENNVDGCASWCSIATIPDSATDWDIIVCDGYEGAECVIFVVDGKIKYAFGGDNYGQTND